MLKGCELHSNKAKLNKAPRILNKLPLGLTTTGSVVRGSPLSGKFMMTKIMEPNVVPTRAQALRVKSFFVAKVSANSTVLTPSQAITWSRLLTDELKLLEADESSAELPVLCSNLRQSGLLTLATSLGIGVPPPNKRSVS